MQGLFKKIDNTSDESGRSLSKSCMPLKDVHAPGCRVACVNCMARLSVSNLDKNDMYQTERCGVEVRIMTLSLTVSVPGV